MFVPLKHATQKGNSICDELCSHHATLETSVFRIRVIIYWLSSDQLTYVIIVHCVALVNSINHEYKEWDEKNPQVTTCNKDTKNLIQGSTVPQEVDAGKEVVFTYDVTFKVLRLPFLFLVISFFHSIC